MTHTKETLYYVDSILCIYVALMPKEPKIGTKHSYVNSHTRHTRERTETKIKIKEVRSNVHMKSIQPET